MGGRFLFVTWDGGGNTAPTYPLVRRLILTGHAVAVLGQSSQQSAVQKLGAEFVPLPVADWTRGKSLEDEMDRLAALLFGPAPGRAVLDAIDRHSPDAVVVDCLMSSCMAAAESAAIPSAALVHFLYAQFVGAGPFRQFFESMLSTLNETRSQFGLPGVASLCAVMDPMNIVLVACPQEFDAPTQRLPANVRYTGAVLESAPRVRGRSQLRSDRPTPLVLVSLSTTFQHQEDALRRIGAALATLPLAATITLGPEIDASIVEPSPNLSVQTYVPHGALLPHCDLVITHAGMGTVMAALAHGVPLLCMPMGREQSDNAARVTACGAGIVLRAEADSAEIRDAVTQILSSDDYQRGATRMAEIIARENGLDNAIKELEALLA